MSVTSGPVPIFHGVRVAKDGKLPAPIHFVLPQLGAPRTSVGRDPGSVYIEDHLPTGNEHNLYLGEFMDAWGHVETSMVMLLRALLDIGFGQAAVLFQAMNFKQFLDTVTNLGTRELSDNGNTKLLGVLDFAKALNSKKNVIVHGLWIIEVAVWRKGSETKFKVRLLRELAPTDYRKRNNLADLRNQRERMRHCFDLDRIRAAGGDVAELQRRTKDFIAVMDAYKLNRSRRHASWQIGLWLEPLHQWTHLSYSSPAHPPASS